MEARLPILRSSLDSWRLNELEGVSNPNSESWLALHAKQSKFKLVFFTIYLEKCEFLQMTPNIGNYIPN